MKNYTIKKNNSGFEYMNVIIFFMLVSKLDNSTLYRYAKGGINVTGDRTILSAALSNLAYLNAFNHAKVLAERFPNEYELEFQEVNLDIRDPRNNN